MATVTQVDNLVRSLVGDDEAAVYTDATLLNFVNTANREVQRKLVNRGCRTLITRAALNLAAAQVAITTASSPALPSDFMLPYKMWEKDTGALDATYVPMNNVSELTDRQQSNYLGEFQFEAGQISLVGASSTKTVRIEYERIFPDFTTGTDVLPVLNSEDAIACLVAAAASRSRGQNDLAKELEAKAKDHIYDLASRHTRANQSIVGVRKAGYGRRSI